jgi:uncharacterized membrane protein
MPPSSTNRLVFLDWLRGLAAVIMLQGHTFDAFADPMTRQGSLFILSQFVGGEAAAIFLLLTGVTFGLGMNKREYYPPVSRVISALKRARYLFLLAILFRVQNWAFSYPKSSVTDLLKVDVLNLMGAMAAFLSVLALFKGMDRVRWAAAAGALIAVFSPVISALPTAALPQVIRDYFVPSTTMFSIFPWGAYFAFGCAAGSMIPLIERGAWNRVMQWSALLGFGLVYAGRYFSDLPYSVYSASEFWLNSPALVACKLGVAMLLASGAYLWTEFFATGWSWIRQLGTTSLFVYWAHIALSYGRFFERYHQRLNETACVFASIAMTATMVGASVLFRRIAWNEVPNRLVHWWKGAPYVPATVYTLDRHAAENHALYAHQEAVRAPARRRA